MLKRQRSLQLIHRSLTASRLARGSEFLEQRSTMVNRLQRIVLTTYYNIESVPTPTTFTYKMATDPQADADAFTGTVNALWQAQQCVIENNIIELIPSYMDWGSPVGIDLIAGPPTPYVDIGARVFRRLVIRNNVIRC